MKVLGIGALFLTGMLSAADRGVRFVEDPKAPEETDSAKKEPQKPRSILIKEGASRKTQRVQFNEDSVVKNFPPRPTKAKEGQSAVVSSTNADVDDHVNQTDVAAIERVDQEEGIHEDHEIAPDDIASHVRVDEEIARVKRVLEETYPIDVSRIRQLNEYLDALANEADFLNFIENSKNFKGVQFSQSQLEDLFFAFDFPTISDGSLQKMNRHQLSVIKGLGDARETSVIRKAKLSKNQSEAVKNYLESRSTAAGNFLDGLKAEEERPLSEQADKTASALKEEIKKAFITQQKDVSGALKKWEELVGEIEKIQGNEYLKPTLAISLGQDLLRIKDKISGINKLQMLFDAKEPVSSEGGADALIASLDFSENMTKGAIEKIMKLEKVWKEGDNVNSQLWYPLREISEMKEKVLSANSQVQNLLDVLKTGESVPDLQGLADLSNLAGISQDAALVRRLQEYAGMSPELIKAVDMDSFLFVNQSVLARTRDQQKLAEMMVDALDMSAELTNLVAKKIEENAFQLPKEDQVPLQSLAAYARSFADLRQKIQDVTNTGDMIALQKLQDQLRDLYERVFQDSFHDASAEFLRRGLQRMTNQLLESVKEKLSTFHAVVTPPLKGVALVKYKFQRFFTYARTALRRKRARYVSELKSNKDGGFGLQIVDFQLKARVQGYVEAASKELEKEKPTPQVVDAVHNEFSALAGIRDSHGTVSPKDADRFLSYRENETFVTSADAFMARMKSATDSKRYRKLARMLLEKNTALGEEYDAVQKIAGKIFPLPDGQNAQDLTFEEEDLVKKIFGTWIEKVQSSMRRTNFESADAQIDLVALQILAEYHGASPAFIKLLKTKETALYALRAFSYGKSVSMPLQEAQLAFRLAQQNESLKFYLKAWELLPDEKSAEGVSGQSIDLAQLTGESVA